MIREHVPDDGELIYSALYVDEARELLEKHGLSSEIARDAHIRHTFQLEQAIADVVEGDIMATWPQLVSGTPEMRRVRHWFAHYVPTVKALGALIHGVLGPIASEEKARVVMDMYRYKITDADGWESMFDDRQHNWFVPEVGSAAQWAHIAECVMFDKLDREAIDTLAELAREYEELPAARKREATQPSAARIASTASSTGR